MSSGGKTRISIMDTTLRDGEQTPDIAYTASEKLHVARMLLADLTVELFAPRGGSGPDG